MFSFYSNESMYKIFRKSVSPSENSISHNLCVKKKIAVDFLLEDKP